MWLLWIWQYAVTVTRQSRVPSESFLFSHHWRPRLSGQKARGPHCGPQPMSGTLLPQGLRIVFSPCLEHTAPRGPHSPHPAPHHLQVPLVRPSPTTYSKASPLPQTAANPHLHLCFFSPHFLLLSDTSCHILNYYWAGQKVHSVFSVRCYGKARTDFLTS